MRKYTIGPYGRVTLHQARIAAQKVFAAKLEGRDPAAEKREAKRRVVADRVDDLLEAFIVQLCRRTAPPARFRGCYVGRRESPGAAGASMRFTSEMWIHVVSAIEQKGAPAAANKALKSIKTFLNWCIGRAVLDRSPAEGVPLPTKEIAPSRDFLRGQGTPSAGDRSSTARPTHQFRNVLIDFSALSAAAGAPRCSIAETTSITSRLLNLMDAPAARAFPPPDVTASKSRPRAVLRQTLSDKRFEKIVHPIGYNPALSFSLSGCRIAPFQLRCEHLLRCDAVEEVSHVRMDR